jgi:hypothetical protein
MIGAGGTAARGLHHFSQSSTSLASSLTSDDDVTALPGEGGLVKHLAACMRAFHLTCRPVAGTGLPDRLTG